MRGFINYPIQLIEPSESSSKVSRKCISSKRIGCNKKSLRDCRPKQMNFQSKYCIWIGIPTSNLWRRSPGGTASSTKNVANPWPKLRPIRPESIRRTKIREPHRPPQACESDIHQSDDKILLSVFAIPRHFAGINVFHLKSILIFGVYSKYRIALVRFSTSRIQSNWLVVVSVVYSHHTNWRGVEQSGSSLGS